MRLYSSLSRRKEELLPPPGPIGMYFCGPTVYQLIHIGNARPFVFSMWLRRWLSLSGYEVKLVENVTDINDKIYDAALKKGMSSAKLAADATRWYVEDTARLGLGRPDAEPLATETVPEIVALIEELVGRGLAYESSGDVYFRVARFPEYGRLSGAQLDDMLAQEPGDLKEDARDFALWKAWKPHEDTWWESPWGRGRPGWHIECSAMAEKHLGPAFEIHGGGLDLRFPHHENEVAQSRGAGREFARLWAHNGMLELGAEKMSKSVGNIVSLREALDKWGREAILVFFLGAHYRSPIEFSDVAMEAARAQAEDFRAVVRVALSRRPEHSWDDFAAALNDDFNTQDALAILHDWRDAGERKLLSRGLSVFGLAELVPMVSEVSREIKVTGGAAAAFGGGGTAIVVTVGDAPKAVQDLAQERYNARLRKDYSVADRLRASIEQAGWDVQDRPNGYRLIPKR